MEGEKNNEADEGLKSCKNNINYIYKKCAYVQVCVWSIGKMRFLVGYLNIKNVYIWYLNIFGIRTLKRMRNSEYSYSSSE